MGRKDGVMDEGIKRENALKGPWAVTWRSNIESQERDIRRGNLWELGQGVEWGLCREVVANLFVKHATRQVPQVLLQSLSLANLLLCSAPCPICPCVPCSLPNLLHFTHTGCLCYLGRACQRLGTSGVGLGMSNGSEEPKRKLRGSIKEYEKHGHGAQRTGEEGGKAYCRVRQDFVWGEIPFFFKSKLKTVNEYNSLKFPR